MGLGVLGAEVSAGLGAARQNRVGPLRLCFGRRACCILQLCELALLREGIRGADYGVQLRSTDRSGRLLTWLRPCRSCGNAVLHLPAPMLSGHSMLAGGLLSAIGT